MNTGYNYDSSVISGTFDTLNFPVLLEEKGALIFDNISIYSITFPVLKNAYSLSFQNSNIRELNLPKILSCKGFYFQSNYQTNTIINIPLLNYCNDFSIRAMNFNSAKTNDWLHQFLTILPISGKNIELYSRPLPAPPTGQGIDDKNTIIANGNTIITD